VAEINPQGKKKKKKKAEKIKRKVGLSCSRERKKNGKITFYPLKYSLIFTFASKV
jgi:hypothetical protein